MKYEKEIVSWLENPKNVTDYDVSYRGGHIKVYAEKLLSDLFYSDENKKWQDAITEAVQDETYWGARCGYLGGGVRGEVEAVCPGVSQAKHEIDPLVHSHLVEFANAFARAIKNKYISLEDDIGLNYTGDDDDPNWDAMATNAARAAGAVSAY